MLIKRLSVATFVVVWSVFFLWGCNNNQPSTYKRETRKPGVADYVVGGEQLKSYQKTKSKLDGINKNLQRQYQEME